MHSCFQSTDGDEALSLFATTSNNPCMITCKYMHFELRVFIVLRTAELIIVQFEGMLIFFFLKIRVKVSEYNDLGKL